MQTTKASVGLLNAIYLSEVNEIPRIIPVEAKSQMTQVKKCKPTQLLCSSKISNKFSDASN